jgi:hypothetical protein
MSEANWLHELVRTIFPMKLYKVRVEYETVIRAESQADAQLHAPYILRHDAADIVTADVIESLADLPQGWDAQCRPWGEHDWLMRSLDKISPTACPRCL